MDKFDIELLEGEDTAYNEIYTDLSVKTDGWNNQNGEVRYSNKTDADIARSILKGRYSLVRIEPLDFKDGDDLVYHITYDNIKEEFDQDGLNWFEDKNPEGTPIGEEFEPAEDYIQCPACQGIAEYIEGQGNFSFYKCLNCGEYWFINSNGKIKSADQAFDENGNLLKESNDGRFGQVTEEMIDEVIEKYYDVLERLGNE